MIRRRIDLNNKGKLQNPKIQDMGGKISKSAASAPVDVPFSVNLSEELMVTLSGKNFNNYGQFQLIMYNHCHPSYISTVYPLFRTLMRLNE
jgi:hypothetical protein